jgi:signal transduction histidine kinase
MSLAFWFYAAAYLTWAVAGLPWMLGVLRGELTGTRAVAGGIAFVGFAVAFTVSLRHQHGGRVTWRGRLPLAVMSLTGLTLAWASDDGLPAALLVVTAAGLPYVFKSGIVAAWIAGQTAALFVLFWTMSGPLTALMSGGALGGFQLFAVSSAALALNLTRAVEALARTNAELTATRELLAENSRVAERLRISRDLHDTLGHHLTALSLQLDVASRLSDGAAAAHIHEAHAVARLLLGDVRDAVSTLRGSNRVDLSQAVRALAGTRGPLQIHLELPERLQLEDAAQAHALLRCVQEIITNTARHASAQNLWIRIDQQSAGIDLHARDDGRGAPEVRWGNGLQGMRERFEEYAGRIEFTSAAGRGFEVRGFMPRPEAA